MEKLELGTYAKPVGDLGTHLCYIVPLACDGPVWYPG